MYPVANDFLGKIAREHGWLLAVTVLSALSALVTLFVDVNAQISVKWLLFTLWIASSVVVILLKAISVAVSHHPALSEIVVVGPQEDGKVLVVKSTAGLGMNALVSIYISDRGHEALCAIGFVENVQSNGITSIRLRARYRPAGKRDKLIVKTTLPNDKIQVVQP